MAMNDVVLTWSVTNWITIIIMVTVGFALLALLAQVFHSNKSSAPDA